MPDSLDIPLATYRLQFHRGFRFTDAAALAPYLAALGVTHCYSSPYLTAKPGSTHGYDICDHRELNPEIGTRAEYDEFVRALHDHGLGQIIDFVPNHMGIDPRTNPWWRDVLENGQSSAFARYFDIDWDPVKPELKGKVLLPILGDQYGLVLERGELRLGFEDGALSLQYFDNWLPVNPRESVMVFEHHIEELTATLGEEQGDLREFLSILTALRNLPAIQETDPARITERRREKEVARERLARLASTSGEIRSHVARAVEFFNGTPGVPSSFDPLHDLLERQAYRLSDWRSASHEINYRRFFDINALAALRMEDPEVFDATHALLRELLDGGQVNGLRIDHPDGLFDPKGYFQKLQELRGGRGPLWIAAEKILSDGESLPDDWPVAGATGYTFANDITGLQIDPAGERPLRQFYARFTGVTWPFPDLVYRGKKLITRASLASELNVLTHALNVISESNRRSRDFTLESLRGVLQEVVSCFPVYRTYIDRGGWTAADRDRIEQAVALAMHRNPTVPASQFDFFREVVLPRRLSAEADSDDRRDGYAAVDEPGYETRIQFSMKLQQFTAPVQAKGVEDTAFYRYNLLVALNEVGGEPSRFGRSPAEVHARNEARARQWPFEMLATSTHDTKLGEDVRARIAVISELAQDWRRHVSRWARINAPHRSDVNGRPAPDRNDEYRFYQVLVGVWPGDGETGVSPVPSTLVERLRDYMMKAIKEAKIHTSWINDSREYDAAMARFVEGVLTGSSSRRFFASFLPFQARVAHLALANSLAQVVLKVGSPGVPDFYQGTELWDLHLVDPDNRQPVDFAARRQGIQALAALLPELPPTAREADPDRLIRRVALLAEMLEDWGDGRIKLWVTAAALRARRAWPELFAGGGYLPLPAAGSAASHLFAFARTAGPASGPWGRPSARPERSRGVPAPAAVVLVPRLVARLGDGWRDWAAAWGTTVVPLPPSLTGLRWINGITGETVETERSQTIESLPVGEALAHCPVAVVVGVSGNGEERM
jgi:(1->4)-alpha-D-glucan 1-alpha-D-glucosylmutase